MSEVKTTLLSVLHSMLTSRSQIWYIIFVGPFGARWAPSGPSGPRHLPGLPLISYATVQGVWIKHGVKEVEKVSPSLLPLVKTTVNINGLCDKLKCN